MERRRIERFELFFKSVHTLFLYSYKGEGHNVVIDVLAPLSAALSFSFSVLLHRP
jgi:hypothetical protein